MNVAYNPPSKSKWAMFDTKSAYKPNVIRNDSSEGEQPLAE